MIPLSAREAGRVLQAVLLCHGLTLSLTDLYPEVEPGSGYPVSTSIETNKSLGRSNAGGPASW